jgi:predicted phage replisome organizer
MAKYDKTNLYWLQLKNDFFDADAIRWIEEQPDGLTYSNIYLKLCLKSLRTDGVLIRQIGGMLLPYDATGLASLIGHKNIADIEKAVYLLTKSGLVQVLDDGAFYLNQVKQMTFKTTKGALLKEINRAKKQNLSKKIDKHASSGQLSTSCPTNSGQKRDYLSTTVTNTITDTTNTNIHTSESVNTPIMRDSRLLSNQDCVAAVPSIAEIELVCKECGYGTVDAQEFWDFYQSKGWKVGNTPMSDWSAALRQWDRRRHKYSNGQGANPKQSKTSNQDNGVVDALASRFEI